jgi:quinol monooxygenase YgiN
MRLSHLLIAAAVLSSLLSVEARCEEEEVYVVSYIEILPGVLDAASALLNRYATASRKEPGNLGFTLLHEIGRTDRFAILEIWKSKSAAEDHVASASTTEFQRGFKTFRRAPIDTRVEQGFCVGQAGSDNSSDGVFVLTHLDIAPERDKEGATLIRAMCAEAAKEPGNLTYDALQQSNRLNHFTLLEHWTSMKALEAHSVATHTLDFRQAVLPMEGALYDERRYKAVPQ